MILSTIENVNRFYKCSHFEVAGTESLGTWAIVRHNYVFYRCLPEGIKPRDLN